ncbi:MAG: alpha/beta fold hydrolase BchO [Granulosicoccus sp.]
MNSQLIKPLLSHTEPTTMYQGQLSPAPSNAPVETRHLRAGNLVWNVRVTGSGPSCLLIHGTGASIHTWENLVPLLSSRLKLIMIDLPGHAQTHTPDEFDLTLPGIARELYRLIEEQNLQPDLIVGHSAGAAIMLQMCLDNKHLNSSLVSINGAVIPLAGIAGYLFSPLARMSSTSGWMSHFFALRARNERNVRKLLDSTGSKIDKTSFSRYTELFQDARHVAGVLKMMANWQLEKLAPRLGDVQNQVQLIASDKDSTIPLRDAYKLNQLLRYSTLSVIKGKGHLVQEEDPSSIARLILAVSNNHQE